MKKYLLLLALFCCFGGENRLLSAQSAEEFTPVSESRMERWRELIYQGNPGQVLDSCNRALSQLKETDQAELAALLTVQASALRSLGAFDRAIQQHQSALAIRLKVYGSTSKEVAASYQNLGNCYLETGNIKEAHIHLEKALQIKEPLFINQAPHQLISLYSSLGNLYQENSQKSKAAAYLKKAFQLAQSQAKNRESAMIGSGINLSSFFLAQNQVDSARALLAILIPIAESHLGEQHPSVARLYNNFGNALARSGQYRLAIEQQQKALAIYRQFTEGFQPEQADCLMNAANSYQDLGNYPTADLYYQQALAKATGDTSRMAAIYNNLGLNRQYDGNPEAAIKAFREAVNLKRESANENPLQLAEIWTNMGDAYTRLNNFKGADFYYRKALKLFDRPESSKRQKVVILHKLGKSKLQQQDREAAFGFLEKARSLLVPKDSLYHFFSAYHFGEFYEAQRDFKAAEIHYLRARDFLAAGSGRSRSIYPVENIQIQASLARVIHLSEVSGLNSQALLRALSFSQIAIEQMEQLKGDYQNDRSVLSLQNNFHELYNTAISICFRLGRDDPAYYRTAFQWADQYKANLLKKLARTSEARSRFALPETVVQKEQYLNKALSFCRKQLYEMSADENLNQEAIAKLNEQLYQLTEEQQQLIRQIRKEHPQYYQLIHQSSSVSVEQIQEQLKANETLLEFQWADQYCWLFLIRPDTFVVRQLENSPLLLKQIGQLDSCYKIRVGLIPTQQKQLIFNKLVGLAQELYHQLISPVESILSEQLVIIPDGPLCYLPFELLIKSPAKEARLFRLHHYLLNEHAVSYNYSAALLLHKKSKDRLRPARKILAVAPVFENNSSPLAPLKHNAEEVRLLHEISGGDYWTAGTDSEELFTEVATQYQRIHLSTHGIMDDRQPQYSYLAFSEQPDSVENEKLFISEIYNLPLQADLVVLSACQTASGRLYRGEGLLSLAHAFSYAGAESLLASLWNVDDRHTPELMQYYYQELEMQSNKSTALQKAKLTYIKNASHEEAYPFYWAGFISIGDTSPLLIDQKERWWIWGIAGMLLLLTFPLIKRLRNQNRK